MDRNTKCHTIIHSASASAAAIGAGLAQFPMADTVPLTGIQVGMVISIAKIFDVKLTEGAAKALVTGFAASAGGRSVSQFLIGWIPGYGNAINATTAATLTEGVGWAAVAHFENLENEREFSYTSGYNSGERDTKEKFKEILEELKKDEMDNLLIVVLFKYIMTKEGYEQFTEGNSLNRQISKLIKDINEKFDRDFEITDIIEFFDDWKGYNKEKGKEKIYNMLKKQTALIKGDYFNIVNFVEVFQYIEQNL